MPHADVFELLTQVWTSAIISICQTSDGLEKLALIKQRDAHLPTLFASLDLSA